jgi:hypothetical protein
VYGCKAFNIGDESRVAAAVMHAYSVHRTGDEEVFKENIK